MFQTRCPTPCRPTPLLAHFRGPGRAEARRPRSGVRRGGLSVLLVALAVS